MIDGTNGFNSLSAGDFKTRAESRFDRFDTNGSGGIDFEEVQKFVEQTGRGSKLIENFDKVDINSDGELDISELRTLRRNIVERRFDRVDQNDSGGIDQTELQTLIDKTGGRGQKLLENFSTVDSDGSGEISLEELKAFRKQNTNPEFTTTA